MVALGILGSLISFMPELRSLRADSGDPAMDGPKESVLGLLFASVVMC